MKEIALTKGVVAVVDDADFDVLSTYNWCVKGTAACGLYAKRHGALMHRQILGVTDPRVEVDHVNGNGLDNRRCNLRLATRGENAHNCRVRAPHTSRFKGVSWDRSRERWRATIKLARKLVYLGRFSDETEAARAYNAAALRLHGAFACPNVIA